jgi:hypothetical protein
VRDLLPDLKSTGGYVLDKVEGLAIMADGTVWVSTDNDGVDDHSGETMFWSDFTTPELIGPFEAVPAAFRADIREGPGASGLPDRVRSGSPLPWPLTK